VQARPDRTGLGRVQDSGGRQTAPPGGGKRRTKTEAPGLSRGGAGRFCFSSDPAFLREGVDGLEHGLLMVGRHVFQLMSRRYEHASTVLTSNKSFEEWGEIFDDEVMAAALIDRLLHHCQIINIRGNSFGMRHHTDLWKQLHPSLARRLGIRLVSQAEDRSKKEAHDVAGSSPKVGHFNR
jgi:hypothetical protein